MKRSNRAKLPLFEGYVKINETFNALWNSSQDGLNLNNTQVRVKLHLNY